jgi:hypothetical protein
MIHQALDQPLTRRAGRRFVPIRNLQRVHTSSGVGQLQVHESAGAQISMHYGLRHGAPTDTR